MRSIGLSLVITLIEIHTSTHPDWYLAEVLSIFTLRGGLGKPPCLWIAQGGFAHLAS